MSDSTSDDVTYYDSGLIVIRSPGSEAHPLNCPVCGFFMLTVWDETTWKESGCCRECSVMWAEGPNKEKWQKGWRPDPEELEIEIEKRSQRLPRLKLALE